MKLSTTVPVLLALVLVPVAAGFAAPTHDLAAPSGDTTLAQQSGSASDSGAASGSASTGSPTVEPANYTRLYVDSERPSLRLKPGEREEYTVTVENAEDHAVELDPRLYVPPAGGPVVEASWVSIDGPDRVAAGETAEFTVAVAIPADAEIGRYSGAVAFTDETVAYPGRPARPVHTEHVRVEVWAEPTVRIDSRTYVRTQVEAGERITREIVIENTGDEPVPLAPEVARDRGVCHGDCPDQFDRSWLDVDAPSQIAPGETGTVTLSIAPPADAERGRYDTRVNLGLKDPNRDDRSTHWQTVDVNVEVWRQPETPFETAFRVSEGAEDVTLSLTPQSGPYPAESAAGDAEPVGFDVEFVDPNGSVVEPTRVRTTDRGFVDTSGDARRATDDGAYAVRSGGREFVSRLDDPGAGEWTLRVTPENSVGFGYEITRNEEA